MGDRYTSFARSGAGRAIVKRLGLPDPPPLRRFVEGEPRVAGPVLIGPDDGPLVDELTSYLAPFVVESERRHALIFDATGIVEPAGLRALYDFFQPVARSLTPSGRVIVLGLTPDSSHTTAQAAAQQALDGFVRSVGKEFGRGTTAQLVRITPGTPIQALRSTLDFLLAAKSAYVSGQTVVVSAAPPPGSVDAAGGPDAGGAGDAGGGPVVAGAAGTGGGAKVAGDDRPLAGKIALVTGAARGIGAAMAKVLARDGAHVICLDLPSAGDDLAKVANEVRGETHQLDLTTAGAGESLVDYVRSRHGRLDILVHNAGITRDKTLANMDHGRWDSVLAVNLRVPVQVTEELLLADLIPAGGRIIGVASIAGIAGNRGQTNYATSKAGVIGWVHGLAPRVADRHITVNAVAPGFIETAMTARMPIMIREAGRRMNSLSQGGLPVDVAEAVAWFAAPGSQGVTGNVVRVCGQSLLGA
jgi:3-oxoacyl-[acyl-carrier protein] reductase